MANQFREKQTPLMLFVSYNDDSFKQPHQRVSHGGNNMDSKLNSLEKEINKMKNDLHEVKTNIAVIKSNYSTKEALAASANKIILWFVGSVILTQLLPMVVRVIDVWVK
ncbi:hypothetical protein [Providencia sp. PROV202]|uniref:hypothetical protein n=1 Tax=Providencia sp. PROV202 TaxID=2949902 RepID=UPI00234B0FD0|nr:hypothetical protein [Providencia sp. PROV202]